MIEGGGVVLSELLKIGYAHLVDSVILTIAPAFFGKAGVPVSPDPTFDHSGKPIATRLRNIKWQPMGEVDVVLCGQMNLDRPANGILHGIEEFSQAAPDPTHQQPPIAPQLQNMPNNVQGTPAGPPPQPIPKQNHTKAASTKGAS